MRLLEKEITSTASEGGPIRRCGVSRLARSARITSTFLDRAILSQLDLERGDDDRAEVMAIHVVLQQERELKHGVLVP